MADEMQNNTEDAKGNLGAQTAGDPADKDPRISPANERLPDVAMVWKEKYLRLFADLENTKKRLSRNSAQEVEAEKEALLRDVLPVADALDLAFMHASPEEDSRSIQQGIELIRNMLNTFFTTYDVRAIDAWGQPFDPRLHEALGVERHPKVPPNTVVRVERKGYWFGDKLLRPAQVVVTPR